MPLFDATAASDHWVLDLRRGRGNSLTLEGLAQLEEFFRARGDDPRAVVLTHRGPSFCTGLDLDEVIALDRETMGRFMEGFHRALLAVFACPVPVVAALGGHAVAGGGLLALCADARILAAGPARIGVHGIRMGITYPQVAVEIARHQLGRAECERALYTGRLLDDREALEAGWVEQLVDGSHLIEVARQRATDLAHNSPAAFAANKRRGRGPALDRLVAFDPEAHERWLDQWFSPSTRRALERRRAGNGQDQDQDRRGNP